MTPIPGMRMLANVGQGALAGGLGMAGGMAAMNAMGGQPQQPQPQQPQEDPRMALFAELEDPTVTPERKRAILAQLEEMRQAEEADPLAALGGAPTDPSAPQMAM